MLFARDATIDDHRPSWAKQIKSLSIILRDEFGVAFDFYEAATGAWLEGPAGDARRAPHATMLDGAAATRLAERGGAVINALPGGNYRLALTFPDGDRPGAIAVGVIAGMARTPDESAQELTRLGKWLNSVFERLRAASQPAGRSRRGADQGGEAVVGLEALMGLEQLLRSQRIDREPCRNRKQVLQAAASALRAQSLLFVPGDGGEALIHGEALLSPWDCGQLARLLVQDPAGANHGYLINNQVQANSWGARFPRVVNLLAVPIPVKGSSSWLIALNKMSVPAPSSGHGEPREGAPSPGSSGGSSGPSSPVGPNFRRTDAAMLLPFAALLGVHLRASRRHQQLKELLVGLTRSLATAIDARDCLVTGHSERVARIAVELARELGLQEDELSDVYLSGLLHDVGKIGVSDSILCKRSPLTPGELAHVQQHVTIGSHLLAELRPIAHLLPAVLHHHERYDGTGYPDGLKGDSIPFLARILAVAESYDAMTMFGPERSGSGGAHAEEVLSQGADLQWDGRVIAAFFRCRDRIVSLLQRGVAESPRYALDPVLGHPASPDPSNLDGSRPTPLRLGIALS